MTDKHMLTLETQVKQSRKIKSLTARLSQTQAELGKALDILEGTLKISGAYAEGRIHWTDRAAKITAAFLAKHGRIRTKPLGDGSVAIMEAS